MTLAVAVLMNLETHTRVNTWLCKNKNAKTVHFFHLTRCNAQFYHAGARDAVGNVSADVLCGQLAQRKARRSGAEISLGTVASR